MPEPLPPLAISLAGFRKILTRRERASLELAQRTTAERFGQAANEEAAFFAGLRLLLDELEAARVHVHGNASQPLKQIRPPSTKVALVISDGAITDVLTTSPRVEIALIDYDCEGFEQLAAIPQGDGSVHDARVSRTTAELDVRRVEELFRIVEAADVELAWHGSASPTV